MGINEFTGSPAAGTRRAPIAIVGIGCRFPGGINGPRTFWRLLQEQTDAIGEIPPDRIDVATYYDPRPALPGKMTSRWGGFLEQIDKFDAAFFGISPREAERMDPQQRLLLELAWESLEDAGQNLDRTDGSAAGVFIGMWLNDYEARLFADPAAADFHMTTGTGRYSASGRLSYFFGFRGPSLTVDTACSSSLVAIHLACRSIWSGECSLALAGGANVILQPQISIAYSQSRMIAPDGRCKFGDAAANGYVRSEGAGIVVLKPVADAVRDGNPIYALIQGSAVNSDGSGSGHLATPARAGQEELLTRAYSDAGISPGRVHYVEAHGTGTIAGDPVEVGALGSVLSSDRPSGAVCYLGSVKTNFGHTEGAAGIAGLIKTALMLKHRMVPASLHAKNLNPAIPWKDYPFVIPRTLTAWPRSSEIAVAGVSAFGIAGTNAHVVLTEAPADQISDKNAGAPVSAFVVPISARSPEALASLAHSYCSMLEDEDTVPLRDLAFTASLRRNHHEHRLTAVSDTRSGVSKLLAAFLRGEQVPGLCAGKTNTDCSRKIVFVCPGQGSQWVGMGRQLAGQEPVFREALLECEQAMRPFVDWSLQEQLRLDPGSPRYRLNEIDVIQPSLLSIEIALAALWRSWGITPDAVVGHSMGEVAAAFVAGALKLEDAMRIICTRSQLLRRVRGNGAMALVALPMEGAEQVVKKFKDRVSAAVSNSPRSTVISGDPAAIGSIVEELQDRNIFCRLVKVDVASHSPQMDSLTEELLQSLNAIEPQAEQTPIYSTVTGNKIEGGALDGAYWTRNLRCPVLFSSAVRRLAENGSAIFIELSPHPILLPSIEETLHDLGAQGYTIPSLERDKDERSTMLASFGRLYTIGFPVDWSRLFPAGGKVVALPSYPWQSRRFWLETRSQGNANGNSVIPQGAQDHPLLGTRLPGMAALPKSILWQTSLGGRFREFLRQHHIEDSVPFPQSIYADMCSAAANAVYGKKLHEISELTIHAPLSLSENADTSIQFILTRTEPDAAKFEVSSLDPSEGSEWKLRVSGKIETVEAEAEWLYELEWKSKPLTDNSLPGQTLHSPQTGRWLIFADGGGVASALAGVLQSRGEDCVLAFAGNSFQVQAPGRFCASPNNPEDIKQLLRAALKPEFKCRGIIYLWGLDSRALDSIGSPASSYALSCDAVLHLLQSLKQMDAEMKWKAKPRIWLVTRGAQAVCSTDSRALSLQQTPLWGLGRVLALEQPDLLGGLVDLPPIGEIDDAPTWLAEELCREILNSDGEDQVALRKDSSYGVRLSRSRSGALKKRELTVVADATYLVTGGLGGLGLHLAQWLVEQGGRHLVLTGRTGLPGRSAWESIGPDTELGKRIAAVRALEKDGAEILIVKADVADEQEMSELWKKLEQQPYPLRGIIHAAGVANPRSLAEMTPNEAHKTMRPKINGAWLLHQLVQCGDSASRLDFFVLFSSAASQLGAQDMGAYAAANHFLDALAHYRRARGLPALCVNWGWWDSPGLVSDQTAAIFRRAGLKTLPPKQALNALAYLLETDVTQATVANIDWNSFRSVFEAKKKRPLLEYITIERHIQSETETGPKENAHTLLSHIQEAPSAEKRHLLHDYILAQVATILGFKSAEGVNPRQGFFKMGMDSMMTVQLRNRLETSLSCALPPTVAFEYPTVESLTDFIADDVIKLNGNAGASIAPVREELQPISEPEEELSEDDLADLLTRKLEQIR